MPRGERKIPLDMAILMTGCAFLLDLLNICLEYVTFGIGGLLMDGTSALTFWMWLGHYEVHLFGSKNIGWSMAAGLIDAVPGGDFLFPWTWRVASLVFTERKDTAPDMSTGNAITPGGFRW